MKRLVIIVISLFLAPWPPALAAPGQGKGEVDFKSIKNVLENDFLQKNVKEKKRQIVRRKKKKARAARAQYDLPKREHFWGFFSEFWLVRNVRKLKWDFKKPDYGLGPSIVQLMERFGFFEQKFKLLLLNDFSVTHMALPGNPGETIFLLSVPFIRSTDLTKREIALLLLEDYVRLQKGYFVKHVMDEELQKFIGGNFTGKNLQREQLDRALVRADRLVFERGFNFQQQFQVTQRLSSLLKSDSELWASYLSLLRKIDKLVKSDKHYANYTKIYPAPEIQIKWLLPEKKVL